MKTILNYLRMESTWRGLVLIATSSGVLALNPSQSESIIAAGLAIVGAILTFRNG